MTSLDCSVSYSCIVPGGKAVVTPISACGPNAICTITNNVPSCVCKAGYFGNGVNCTNSNFNLKIIIYKIFFQITDFIKDVCDNTPSVCGNGALCESINGTAVCSCPEKKPGNPLVRCCGN